MKDSIVLEYVWLDGYKTANLRSKVKVISRPDPKLDVYGQLKPCGAPTVGDIPIWNFDGSSTNQAPGNDSERLLKPIRVYKWAQDHYFVLCEVFNNDNTPHETNTRSTLVDWCKNYADKEGFWWGFEQEYFITKDNRILGFPEGGYPPPQGPYYCGVGSNQIVGRELSEYHLRTCLDMGITLTGTNAEVAIGQWEYQCFAEDTLKACDDLWISRYILYRLAESKGWDISLNPKPVHGDWNGSGCHTNFSTNWMREDDNNERHIVDLMEVFRKNHAKHIESYGENNHQRLTGLHETQSIDKFSWGVGDRGASIRIPVAVAENDWKGYVEDRRPASNCDPYRVATLIVRSTKLVET